MRDLTQRNRLLILGLLLLPALVLPFTWLYAQGVRPVEPPADDVLRFSRNIPGDAKPIQLAADEVHAWTEGKDQHFLLRGQVLIQHGVFQMRAEQAVVFVDMAAYKARGIWRAEVYAEGNIQFDNSNENRKADRASIDLNTRGEIKVHSGRARLSQQNMGRDPLVVQGQSQRQAIEIPRLQAAPPVTITPPTPYVAPGAGGGNTDGVVPGGALPGLPTPQTPAVSPGIPGGTPPVAPAGPYIPPGISPGEPSAPPLPALPLPPSGPTGRSNPPNSGEEGIERAGFQDRTVQPAPTTEQAVFPPAPEIVVTRQQPGEILPPPAGVFPPGTPGEIFPPGPPGGIFPPGTPEGMPGGAITPLPPPAQPVAPPPLPPLSLPDLPERRLAISPRTSAGFGLGREQLPSGEQALIVTGGVILNIRGAPKVGIVDLEADRLVIITKKGDPQEVFNGMRNPDGQRQNPDVEFYLAGNVEIRQPGEKGETRTIRADEVYYDVRRSVAIALRGTLEIRDPKLESPIIAHAQEIVQTSTTTFEVVEAEFFASRLPSDPGLKVYVSQASIEERKVPQLGIFGQAVDRRTGQPIEKKQTWVRATDVWFELEGVPIFYTPFLAGDARDPFGPVEDIRLGYDRIFGAQVGVTLNIYDLIGMQAYDGTRWSFLFDYLSDRGAGLGSNFTYKNQDIFGIPSDYEGVIRTYGLFDHGEDNLGGYRPSTRTPTDYRARALWRHGWYDLPYGFQFQSQLAYLTDRNYLEQYFKQEFDIGIPQETFVYLKQQQENAAWTLFANYRIRDWVTETESLPRVDGYLLGQTFFDMFVYNGTASAGFYRLKTSNDPLPMINPVTDVDTDTGRIDWWQEVALPFKVGPVNVVPYARLDLTGYSQDLQGEMAGRVLGGGGIRTAMPLSRLDADIQSDLFNLNGLHHKMVFSTNWYYAESTEPFDRFAQLDRVNLDVSDQQVKEIRAVYPSLLGPAEAAFLSTDLFDPQRMAIRRLVDNRIDTRDEINVVQLGWSNRWQTKRGFPGSQHIIDWMTLDLSASIFPQKDRDNFGSYVAFLEYDWVWNIGDRTALVSSGWVDPIDGGARVFNVGGFYNRPDGTSFYLGYRNIDPLNSRTVIASATYTFSPKYSGTAAIMYDFGSDKPNLNQMFVFNRVGTDLTLSIGANYNSLQNNFGIIFQIVPNLMPRTFVNLAGLGQPGAMRNGIN